MKKIMILNTLILASSLYGCNPKEILEPNLTPSFVVIDGDTIKTRDDKINKEKLKGQAYSHFAFTGDTAIIFNAKRINKLSKKTDLTNIASPLQKGKPFRMVVFGGSLAAGVRDGGVYNEAMETSFGSLIANQMGIDFKNPLFDPQDYNGFGRFNLSNYNPTKGPIPKFKLVTNNSGIDGNLKHENGDSKLKPASINYDNYSFPFSTYIKVGESNGYLNPKYGKTYLSSMQARMGIPNITAQIKAGKSFDFFIMETSYQDKEGLFGNENEYQKYLETPEFDFATMSSIMGIGVPHIIYNNFVKKLERIQAKGVILNAPFLDDCPSITKNYKAEFEKIINTYQLKTIYLDNGKGASSYSTEQLLRNKWFSGGSSLDSLLSPVVNINLRPGINPRNPLTLFYNDDISLNEKYILEINNATNYFASKMNYPVVDIHALYKKIIFGSYSTHDGILVSPKWPGGNFFSQDGVNPTAFGQAVIANEIIKTINSYYKTSIPYINTKELL